MIQYPWQHYTLAIASICLLLGLSIHQAFLLTPGVPAVQEASIKISREKPEIRYDALFGRYEGKDRPLQETGLSFQLTGIFTTQDPLSGSAVISASGRKPLLVTVGDKMPGGVKLIEVYEDRVVLEQAGEQSVLRLPKKSL